MLYDDGNEVVGRFHSDIGTDKVFCLDCKEGLSIKRQHGNINNTDPIDVNSNINKTLQAVDSAGVQNVNVIGDFTISNPTANVVLTVTRLVITLEISSGLWDATTGAITASAL